jgi:hypothetical protein
VGCNDRDARRNTRCECLTGLVHPTLLSWLGESDIRKEHEGRAEEEGALKIENSGEETHVRISKRLAILGQTLAT